MALSIYDRFITRTDSGATIGGASVTVTVPGTGALAQLYEDRDGEDNAANPFTADPNGRVQFYLAPGRYNISATGGGVTINYPDVLVGLEFVEGVQSVATIADLSALTGVVAGQNFSVYEFETGLGWGGGDFVALSGSPTVNNVETFSSVTSGIYFKRKDVTVFDFDMGGIAGDGTTDDTVKLQAVLNAAVGRKCYLNRHCRLTATGLAVPSDTQMEFGPEGFLELLPHNTGSYAILSVRDVGDVEIINPRVDGRRDLNSAVTGEFGMGISIRGTTGLVRIINPVANNCWGDGYYIGASTQDWCDNVEIENPKAHNNRRQGLSLISAKRLVVNGGDLGATTGTAPAAGIDIEPNSPNNHLGHIRFNNVQTYTNVFGGAAGILVYLSSLGDANGKTIDIEFNNCTDNGSTNAATVIGSKPGLKGRIQFNNPVSLNALLGAYVASDCAAAGPRVEFLNPVALNPNRNASSGVDLSAPLNIKRLASSVETYTIGNVHFINPVVVLESGTTGSFFHAANLTGASALSNCSLVDPVITGASRAMKITNLSDVNITDKFQQLYVDTAGSFSPNSENSYGLRVRHTRVSGNSGFTLTANSFVGNSPMVFENMSGGQFTISPPASSNFVGHAVGVNIVCATSPGHRVVIEKLSATLYRVLEQQGSITFV